MGISSKEEAGAHEPTAPEVPRQAALGLDADDWVELLTEREARALRAWTRADVESLCE